MNDKNVEKIIGFKFYRCPVHFHLNTTPCPWPECPNGAGSEKIEIEVLPLLNHKNPIYIRKSCENYLNEQRYYWDREGELNDWPAMELTQNEIRRVQGFRGKNDLIYHYTTVESFISIVESNELWMSDYSYLNDVTEIGHGLNLTKDIVEEFDNNLTKGKSKKIIAGFRDVLSNVNLPRICLTSFSIEGDSLSQWRGYGKGVNSVSVGFDYNDKFWASVDDAYLNKVIYTLESQQKLLRHFLHYHRKIFELDLLKPYRYLYPKGKGLLGAGGKRKKTKISQKEILQSYIDIMKTRFLTLITLFKNEAFEDEREVRLIYSEFEELYNKYGIKCAPKRFRYSKGLIIPYSDTKFLQHRASEYRSKDDNNELHRLPIKEVIIGPQENQDTIIRGTKEFLVANDYGDVEVKKSAIPYR